MTQLTPAAQAAYWQDWYHNKGGREKAAENVRRWRRDNPHRHLYANRKSQNAKGHKHEWTIEFSDLTFPVRCPVLDIELDYTYGGKGGRGHDNSPSLDRIDNSRGYVKGNVIVVSQLANRIKTSATPEQIRRVADFYAALHATGASGTVGTTSE
jgi:hypothetical protein